MTKHELLRLALETAIRDEITYAPENFKAGSKELEVKANRVYTNAKRQRDEIFELMNGTISLDDLEDE